MCCILSFPPPADVKSIQKFLGMFNFYRCSLPHIAGVLKPLTDATTGKSFLFWILNAFRFPFPNFSLVSAVLLYHPISSAHLSIAMDASDSHVGAVFWHWCRGFWQPPGFLSYKLLPAESCYLAFDCDLLAAYLSVLHFRFFLEGRTFTLFTEKNLLSLPFPNRILPSLPINSDVCLSFLNSPQILSTFPVKEMLPLASFQTFLFPKWFSSYLSPSCCLDYQSAPSLFFPLPLSYLQLAKIQQFSLSIPHLQCLPSISITSFLLSSSVSLLGCASTDIFQLLITLFSTSKFWLIHTLNHPGVHATWQGM